jgi:hypothetical protein
MLPKLRSKRLAASATFEAPPLAPRQSRTPAHRPGALDTTQQITEIMPEVSPVATAVPAHTASSPSPMRAARSRSPGPKSPSYTQSMMRHMSPVRVESSDNSEPPWGATGAGNSGNKGLPARRRIVSAAGGRAGGIPPQGATNMSIISSNSNGGGGGGGGGLPLTHSTKRLSVVGLNGDGDPDTPVRVRGRAPVSNDAARANKVLCLCAFTNYISVCFSRMYLCLFVWMSVCTCI